jgi:hypothetical protein
LASGTGQPFLSGLDAVDQGIARDTNVDGQGGFVLNTLETNKSMMLIGSNDLYESTNRGDVITDITPAAERNQPGVNLRGIAYGGRDSSGPNPFLALVAFADNTLFLRTSQAGGLVRDTAWNTANGAPLIIKFDPQSWHTAYITTNQGVFEGTNVGQTGETWTEITANLHQVTRGNLSNDTTFPSDQRMRGLEVVKVGTNTVVLVGDLNGLYEGVNPAGVSTNWFRVGANLPNVLLHGVTYDATSDVLVVGTFGRGTWTLANAWHVLIPPFNLTINFDQQADNVVLRLDPNNSFLLDVFEHTNPTNTPDAVVPLSALSGVTVNAVNLSGNLAIDDANGTIFLPTGGITFNAGSAQNVLEIDNGNVNFETYTVTGRGTGTISLDGATISYTGLAINAFSRIDDFGTATTVIFNDTGAQHTVMGNDVTGNTAATQIQDQDASGNLLVFTKLFNKKNLQLAPTGGNATVTWFNPNPTYAFGTFQVNTGGGENNIDVGATAGTLTINGSFNGQPGIDTVTLGGTSAGAQQAHGTVQVSNSAFTGGSTRLIVDDSGDQLAKPQAKLSFNSGLGQGTITNLTQNTITYNVPDVDAVVVLGGSGANTFTVDSTPFSTATAILTGHSSQDMVNVGNAQNTLNGILGPLTVNGQSGSSMLNLNDTGDTASVQFSSTGHTVTRLPSGPIISFFNIILHIHTPQSPHGGTSPGAGPVVNILSTAADAPVEVDSGGNTTVNVGNGQNGLDQIQGAVTFMGSGFGNQLNANDQMTAAGQTYNLLQTGLMRTGAAPINFQGIQGEDLQGGGQGNLFMVDGIAQGTPTTIDTGLGNNLTRMIGQGQINSALILNGQGTTDRVSYLAYTEPVYVNFQTHVATDIAGLNGTFNVTGGGGDSILVGDGNEDLTGGTGHNLIISGGGTGQLTGGGAGDLIIGANVTYASDPEPQAQMELQAILAEWTRTDLSYAQIVHRIKKGNDPMDPYPLTPGTIVYDNGAANTITGNGGNGVLNLFFVTANDQITDHQKGERRVKVPAPGAPNIDNPGSRSASHRLDSPIDSAAYDLAFLNGDTWRPTVAPSQTTAPSGEQPPRTVSMSLDLDDDPMVLALATFD